MRFTLPRGTQDILPEESKRFLTIENKFREIAEVYGYLEIRTPMFENTELFSRGVGESTDIVSKEMYTFTTRGGDSLTLRPEGTVNTARAVIQNNLLCEQNLTKLYYVSPHFRYERPQKGRYRQFTQVGLEAIGSDSPLLDAEILALAHNFLLSLGINDAKLEINSIGCENCRPLHREALKSFFYIKQEFLCTDCSRRYDFNPMRILDCKNEKCKALSVGAPLMIDMQCEDCKCHFEEVLKQLGSLKIPYTVNPYIVRGLDYYTKTAFEFIAASGLGSQGTILGGGRYDKLVEELGGPKAPAIGFGAGVERLSLASENTLKTKKNAPVFVAALGREALLGANILTEKLRESGVFTVCEYKERGLKGQMKEANKLNSPYVIIIGEDELKNNNCVLKEMENGTQEILSQDKVIKVLINLLKG